MTDVAYLCHNCGSVHEVETIRENLLLDLRTAASYEVSGQRGWLDPRAYIVRWRMTWGLARAFWPGYSAHPHRVGGRRLVQGRASVDMSTRSPRQDHDQPARGRLAGDTAHRLCTGPSRCVILAQRRLAHIAAVLRDRRRVAVSPSTDPELMICAPDEDGPQIDPSA